MKRKMIEVTGDASPLEQEIIEKMLMDEYSKREALKNSMRKTKESLVENHISNMFEEEAAEFRKCFWDYLNAT